MYPAVDQNTTPAPCKKIFNGYIFKFVINIPLKINAVPSHFNPSILSISHLIAVEKETKYKFKQYCIYFKLPIIYNIFSFSKKSVSLSLITSLADSKLSWVIGSSIGQCNFLQVSGQCIETQVSLAEPQRVIA